MNAWQITLLAVFVLWLQALILSSVALNALRARFQASWNAMLHLERLRMAFLAKEGCGANAASAQTLERVRTMLSVAVFPESPQAPEWLANFSRETGLLSAEADRMLKSEQARLALPFREPVLSERLVRAREETIAALDAYEKRRIFSARWVGGPLVAWMGYIPYSAVGISLNLR